jgi:hypothetical protein
MQFVTVYCLSKDRNFPGRGRFEARFELCGGPQSILHSHKKPKVQEIQVLKLTDLTFYNQFSDAKMHIFISGIQETGSDIENFVVLYSF